MISSVLVITSKNPVISVLFLISVFVNSAIYLMLTGVSFIGISYIIVYVGAIAILFLFILMMINIKLTDILEVGKDYTKNFPLVLIIGFFFLTFIGSTLQGSNIDASNGLFSWTLKGLSNININLMNQTNLITLSNNSNFSESLLNQGITSSSNDFYLNTFSQIEVLGHDIYTHSAILLILTSFILLLSMLSPIVLSSAYKK